MARRSWRFLIALPVLAAIVVSTGCSGGLPNDCAGLQKKMEDDVAAAQKDPSAATDAGQKEVAAIQKKMEDLNCGAATK